VKGNVLPATLQCPLCSKRALDVYQDSACGGQWFYCRGCHATGDMIELICSVWKVNTTTALHKVKEAGLDLPVTLLTDEAIADYHRRTTEPRRRVRAYWKACQEHFLDAGSGSVRSLQHLLGVHVSELTWLRPDSLFVGSASAKDTVACLRTAEKQLSRVFPGKGWHDVLVIPFYDLPGRICAFQFIGRKGEYPEDFIFRPAPEFAYPSPKQGKSEAGVALAGTIGKADPVFGSTVFALDNPHLATLLQLRSLRTNMRTLPIVAIYSDDNYHTERVWEWLPAEDVIAWSPRIHDRLFAHAREANASISTYKLPEMSIDDNLNHKPVTEWLTSIKKKSKLWEVATRQQLLRLPPNRIEELFTEMGFNDADRRKFIESCSEELQEKIRKIYEARPTVRRVHYGKHIVCESEGCWWVDDAKQSKIANAIVRIEKTLRASNGRSYYQGVVLFDGKKVEFLERTDRLDRNLWVWCREYLRDTGVGIPNFTKSWEKDAFQLSTLFCTPKIVKGVDTVGWDEERRQFNFPQFAISGSGELLSDYVCLFRGPVTPGENLPPPTNFTKDEVEILGDDNDESRIFWALAAGVAFNIVAPAINMLPCGVLLDGDGAQAIGKMAASYLGCPEMPKMTPRLMEQQQHNWPTVIEMSDYMLQQHQAWLMSPTRNNAVLMISSPACRVLGIRQHWNIIRCRRKLGSMQLLNRLASRVLPAYIEDLCSRRLYYEHLAENGIETILRDMANWFLRARQGNSHTILSALDLMELPGTYPAWRHFVELLYELVTRGRLGTLWEGFDSRDTKSILFDRENQRAWLPQRQIVDGIEAVAGISPDTLLITKTLEDSDVLLEERKHAGHLGWVLRSDWLEKQFETVKAKGEV